MPDLQRDVVPVDVRVALLWFLSHQYICDNEQKRCKMYYSDEQYPIDHRSQPPLMTWRKTGEWLGEMPALKW